MAYATDPRFRVTTRALRGASVAVLADQITQKLNLARRDLPRRRRLREIRYDAIKQRH